MSPTPSDHDFFPFDHVIITFPDAATAQTAAAGPISRVLQPAYPQVRFTATSDPYDARVGSGGGTAAALLDHAAAKKETIVILHAGGAASRCPTQMCLGKAWTSLPMDANEESLPTPLHLWLQQCRRRLAGIPSGSVVVIASDTLLQLDDDDEAMIDWTCLEDAATVVGLAVPAPLETASHHGVFVIAAEGTPNESASSMIQPCRAVLQKPSVEAMQSLPGCCFPRSNEVSAWIDAGVTIFSPRAAAMFLETARTLLQRCTATGLRALYEAQAAPNHDSHITLPEFAAQHALSVDLYTHILQALALSEFSVASPQSARRDAYVARYAHELPAAALWQALSPVRLQVLTVPSGRFWHLGTTRELRDFLVDAASAAATPAAAFGARLGMTRRVRAYTALGGGSGVDPSAVIVDSILSVQSTGSGRSNDSCSSIGARTVIEHCDVEVVDAAIRIGNNCVVSGLRVPSDPQSRGGFFIPDNMVVQMVQLSSTVPETKVVIMVLGIDDEIKKRSTLYGVPIDTFFLQSGLSDADLWDDPDPSHNTIWTAKIHPVISLTRHESFATVFSWLRYLESDGLTCERSALEEDASFIRWKSSRRLALSEIRDRSDARYEFQFRENLLLYRFPQFRTSYNERLVAMLRERRQFVPIDFQFLVDGYVANVDAKSSSTVTLLETLHALDTVIRDCMNQDGSHDIGSRACMFESNLLEEIVEGYTSLQMREKLEDLPYQELIDPLVDFDSLISLRDEYIRAGRIQGIATSAAQLQGLASSLTGRHVLAARGMQLSLHRQPPIHDRWVLAAAPARIDLSGGWSDTPPICYEFGSLVVGMAVLIDGRKPLLCRCRIVSGGTGILLRTETRDSTDGDLLAMAEKEITSMDGFMDYQNPATDCALLMCALVHLGFAVDEERDFQSKINAFCRSESASARLEVIATTTLPQGSGLGSSSILAGCILAAVGKCVGAGNQSSTEYVREIVDSVLNVEQYLTTGGGFQDQVNGLVGGIKAVSSSPNVSPMKVTIESLAISTEFRSDLEQRLALVFTGKTRLAKNLLKQVLTRWSKQTPEIIDAVSGLVAGAEECRDSIASSSVDLLGKCLSEYWKLKKVMAGLTSGVEPQIVSDMIRSLSGQGLIKGASLCGAGGGGFMVLLCSAGVSVSDLKNAMDNDSTLLLDNESVSSLSWHGCTLCDEGLTVQVLDSADGSMDDFDIEWLSRSK